MIIEIISGIGIGIAANLITKAITGDSAHNKLGEVKITSEGIWVSSDRIRRIRAYKFGTTFAVDVEFFDETIKYLPSSDSVLLNICPECNQSINKYGLLEIGHAPMCSRSKNNQRYFSSRDHKCRECGQWIFKDGFLEIGHLSTCFKSSSNRFPFESSDYRCFECHQQITKIGLTESGHLSSCSKSPRIDPISFISDTYTCAECHQQIIKIGFAERGHLFTCSKWRYSD